MMKWYPQSKCNRTADISVLYNHEKPSIVYQCDDYHDYTYLLILLASIKKVELKGNHLKHVQLLDKCISSLFLITKEIIVATWSLDITSYICRWFFSMFTGHTNHTVIRSGGHSLLRHPLWRFLFFPKFYWNHFSGESLSPSHTWIRWPFDMPSETAWYQAQRKIATW